MEVKRRNWPGTRVGNLIVLEATEDRKNGYTIWQCHCDCGNEINLDTRALKRGTVRDCGCVTKVRPGQRDLTGQRFGKLVCMEPLASRTNSGNVIWRCRCDCGNECAAPVPQLTKGYKKSCGCLGHPPLKDYVGTVFGKLTVLEYAGKPKGEKAWRCRCDCGNITVVVQRRLESGRTKSCGCIAKSMYQENCLLVAGTSIKLMDKALAHKLSKNNVSGHTGVRLMKENEKWEAYIHFRYKKIRLGIFDEYEEAVAARERGEMFYKRFRELYDSGELTEENICGAAKEFLYQAPASVVNSHYS